MSLATGTLARAGLVVSIAVFVSRVLGWLRTVVITTTFGAGPDLDAYFAAFRLPDLVFQLVAAGALASALVPVLAGLLAHDEEARAWHVVSVVANVMLLVLVPLILAGELLAPVLVPLITPAFSAAQLALTVDLTRLMLLSPLFLALGAVASSALNARGRFAAAAAGAALYNVAIIGAALLLAPSMGVRALAVGVVAGAILTLAIQVPQLVRGGAHYQATIRLHDPAAREALLLMAPRAFGLGVTQITFLVNTSLATTVGTGALVAYNVAFTILQIPIGLIGVPLGIVLLPSLARAAALDLSDEFGHLVTRAVRLLLYVMLFLTAVLMVIRVQVVTVLFSYGLFDLSAIEATASALLFFLVGLAGHALIQVLARTFYAAKDTRTPVAAAVISVVINVVVSVLTVGSLGLAGLALGIAAGAWIESALLLGLLGRRDARFRLGPVVRAGGLDLAGAALAAAAAWAVTQAAGALGMSSTAKLDDLVVGGVAFVTAGTVYVVYSRLLRLPELAGSLALARSATRRLASLA
ncbi:MAG TPA: murein biosynthesis integral membrane protein MurJ [Candidatus Sulfotelmatobacter sp.]|nr:murein biosynthesis integral membrane protein MurJ [Candidatus Sulfotelmatobacter sp.]